MRRDREGQVRACRGRPFGDLSRGHKVPRCRQTRSKLMTAVDDTSLHERIAGRIYDRPTQAVILAGGRGTRMRPITDDRPKPMVPVLERPFLEYQIEQLRDQGFERVLILLGYLAEVVQNHFGDGRDWGVHIEYSVTSPDQLTHTPLPPARHLTSPPS